MNCSHSARWRSMARRSHGYGPPWPRRQFRRPLRHHDHPPAVQPARPSLRREVGDHRTEGQHTLPAIRPSPIRLLSPMRCSTSIPHAPRSSCEKSGPSTCILTVGLAIAHTICKRIPVTRTAIPGAPLAGTADERQNLRLSRQRERDRCTLARAAPAAHAAVRAGAAVNTISTSRCGWHPAHLRRDRAELIGQSRGLLVPQRRGLSPRHLHGHHVLITEAHHRPQPRTLVPDGWSREFEIASTAAQRRLYSQTVRIIATSAPRRCRNTTSSTPTASTVPPHRQHRQRPLRRQLTHGMRVSAHIVDRQMPRARGQSAGHQRQHPEALSSVLARPGLLSAAHRATPSTSARIWGADAAERR